MTLKQRIRAFLGIDALPSRLEITEIRQILESNHLELKEILAKHVTQTLPVRRELIFPTLTTNWDQMQLQELAEMIANQPKEEQ
jgi:hypothetical protein